jgi:tetratricopeptide (TPR) repeat protein
MNKLFFSYARQDQDQVVPLARELQGLGVDVWLDIQGIKGGSLWADEIVNTIRNCEFFLLFISLSSINSDNVRREMNLAYESGKRIIPIRLDKAEIPPEWKYQLAGIQWIDSAVPDWKSRLLIALGGSKVSAKDEMELLIAADDKYYSGQYVDAIKLYERVLSLNPSSSRANEYLIRSKDRNRYEKDRAYIPNESLELYKQARAHIVVNEFGKAISLLERAIEIANEAGIAFLEAEEWLDALRLEYEHRKKPKVFISYSRDDYEIASEIYLFLRENQCIPWMDKYDLVPGQEWKLEIHKNINSSDFFVACLSNNSVSKKGYAQKELKEAITILDEVPEGQIYIIPIRLDDCIVPVALTEKHWLDWLNPNAKVLLLRAVETKKL